MTCKDCLSYVVCGHQGKLVQVDSHTWYDYAECDDIEKHCIDFKNKADFVEVVRCKDCKKFVPYEGEEHKGDCEEFPELESCIYEDDFCSYGERRDI